MKVGFDGVLGAIHHLGDLGDRHVIHIEQRHCLGLTPRKTPHPPPHMLGLGVQPDQRSSTQRRQPDISLARELLGWEPVIPLRDGLAKTIAYFRALSHGANGPQTKASSQPPIDPLPIA